MNFTDLIRKSRERLQVIKNHPDAADSLPKLTRVVAEGGNAAVGLTIKTASMITGAAYAVGPSLKEAQEKSESNLEQLADFIIMNTIQNAGDSPTRAVLGAIVGFVSGIMALRFGKAFSSPAKVKEEFITELDEPEIAGFRPRNTQRNLEGTTGQKLDRIGFRSAKEGETIVENPQTVSVNVQRLAKELKPKHIARE